MACAAQVTIRQGIGQRFASGRGQMAGSTSEEPALWSKSATTRSDGLSATTLTIDGERIYLLEEGGAEAGLPILLIHGFPGSSFTWHRIMPLLSASRRLIAPDLVGLGRSDRRPVRPLTLSAQADRMARLRDHLGVARVDGVRLSM